MKKETTPEINFSDHESTFSLSFSYFCRLFSAKANFFQICFCCSNFSFFSSRGNKQILVSLGRVQYCFFVPQVELCCPLGEFLSFGTALLSFSGSLKLRFSFTRKTQKGRPLGQKFSRGTTKLNLRDKNNIVPSLGTPKFVCFLSKKRKKLSSKKKFAKKIGLGRKKSVKR